MSKSIFRRLAPIILGIFLLGGLVHWGMSRSFQIGQHEDLLLRLSVVRIQLEKDISEALLIIRGIAHFIAITPDVGGEQFRAYAAMVVRENNVIRNIGVAPGLVIRHVYPLAGNEAVVGKAYRDLPGQWPGVKEALDAGDMVVSGPLELIQGGTGLIGRMPVFLDGAGERRLWGMVSSVIDMDFLYERIRVNTLGLSIAIRKTGEEQALFLGSGNLFRDRARAVILPVILPGARWEIAGVPEQGWKWISGGILFADGIMLVLGCAVVYLSVRAIRKNDDIADIRRRLDEAQAISHLGSWSMDLNKQTFWLSDENYRILGVERDEGPLTMEQVLNFVPGEEQDVISTAIQEALDTCGRYAVDHRLIRPDGQVLHVEARGQVECGPDGKPKKFTGTLLDITARKKAEEALKAGDAQIRAMARASHDAMIMIDAEDRILFWSDAAEKMFGWTSDEAMGRTMHDMITLPTDRDAAKEGLSRFVHTGTGPVVGRVKEFESVRRDGTIFPVERSVAAFRMGNAYYAVGSLRDITDRKEKEQQLIRLATTDGLTGLLNRRRFMEMAQKSLNEALRYRVPFSVIMFDADKFKRINDVHGHEAGDRVLVDMAKLALKEARNADFVGRLGGEEFALGLPHTDLDGAAHLAERIRLSFGAASLSTDTGEVLRYTASFGVACSCEETVRAEDLVKLADQALYRAKEGGRNRVEV